MFPISFQFLALALSILLPTAEISAPQLPAHPDPNDAVTHRYREVIAKTHDGSIRAADLERLIVAVDLRNRHAAANLLDKNVDAELSRHRSDLIAHGASPSDLDRFLAQGGVRHLWRLELEALRLESSRRAALESPTKFRPAAYDAESDIIRYESYDGFYGDPAPDELFQANNICHTIDFLTGWTSIVCLFSSPFSPPIVNPFCYASVVGLLSGPICSIVAGGTNA